MQKLYQLYVHILSNVDFLKFNFKSFLFVPNWLWRILHAMDKEGNKESEMEMMMAGISLFSFPLLFHRGRRCYQ